MIIDFPFFCFPVFLYVRCFCQYFQTTPLAFPLCVSHDLVPPRADYGQYAAAAADDDDDDNGLGKNCGSLGAPAFVMSI